MPSQTLLSFRAGKMNRENNTSNTVIPDLRKGYIQLVNEDDLLHFQWKERSSVTAEDDLIVFPDDAKFVHVPESNARVYMLKFESSTAKHLFWMQDGKSDRDDWNVERIAALIADPMAPAAEMVNGQGQGQGDSIAGALGGGGGRGVMGEDALGEALDQYPGGLEAFLENMQGGGIRREDLLELLTQQMCDPLPNSPAPLFHLYGTNVRGGQFPGASQEPAASAPQSQPQSQQLPANLQSQLASISAGLSHQHSTRREYFSLNDVLSRDVINRVLNMDGIGERLRPGLPENWDTDQASINEVVQSPQFQQVTPTSSP
jgi:hypothetical protein